MGPRSILGGRLVHDGGLVRLLEVVTGLSSRLVRLLEWVLVCVTNWYSAERPSIANLNGRQVMNKHIGRPVNGQMAAPDSSRTALRKILIGHRVVSETTGHDE